MVTNYRYKQHTISLFQQKWYWNKIEFTRLKDLIKYIDANK